MTSAVLACLLAAAAAGCGSSGNTHASGKTRAPSATPSAIGSLRSCLRRRGYSVSPESAAVRRTAPSGFEFVAVWNLLNPDRIALTLTISKGETGAARAAAWTRKENARLGKGVVRAPVVRFGRIDVLWTAVPRRVDENDIYGCVRPGR